MGINANNNMQRKLIFNKNGERGTSSIIKGNSTNLREWNRIKYDWAYNMYKTMLNNFWIPDEISLADDIKQFPLLSKDERFAVDRIISFLNFLDSIQSENLPNLVRYISAPEITSLLNIQTFQEEVHAQSYSYILDTITDPITRDKIYDMWRDEEVLLERIEFITKIYQDFATNDTEENFLKVVMANYVLEGIYFYSGFMFFYTLARQEKLSGTASIFKYINRDETTHLVIFQNIIKTYFNEFNVSDEIKEELRELMRKGVEWEIKWGTHVTNDKILGISNEVIDKYIKYLSTLRLRAIGLEPLYPEYNKNPIDWIDSFSRINDTKTDFFEAKVVNYTKSSQFKINELE